MKIYQVFKNQNSKKVTLFGISIYTKTISSNYCKRKLIGGIFKTEERDNIKRYYFCGIPFLKKIKPTSKPTYNITNAFIMEYFCTEQQKKYINNPLNINKLLKKCTTVIMSCSKNYLEYSHNWTKYLFAGNLYTIDILPYDNKNADLYVLLGGVGQTPAQINVVVEAMQVNKPVLILEAAFLRSINTFCEQKEEAKYRYDVGFVLDYLTAYYDATRPSYLELMLNDKNLTINTKQRKRAKKCIDIIVKNSLTKYNYQPIFQPKIGRDGVKKILVVDQSFGDNSIKKGLACNSTFKIMLDSAIEENPNADIIVKTHPDTMSGARGGYYTGLKQHNNIYPMIDPINPISLIKYVDKVYVCTTQLGFESLMCGKETHVFGMPFYAGWGISNDRQICKRRTNKRSLEEIFYITYIMYSYYVNPNKQCRCEIEEAMDHLLKLREEYFNKLNSVIPK